MENAMLTHRGSQEIRDEKVKNIKKYLQTRVMPILEPLQIAILRERPDDIRDFCISYLKAAKHTEFDSEARLQLENDQIPEHIFREQVARKRKKTSRRGIVGDRPKGGFLQVGQIYLSSPGYSYPQQIVINLMLYLKKCVFFEHLSTGELVKVIQRMRIVEFEAGEVIIRQGQSGHELYIVDSGILKCEKENKTEILKIFKKGEVFGELSLLYNSPRASSVTAIEKGRLFSLQRAHFSAILHLGMVAKIKECEILVDKIDIFDSLNIYQKTKLYQSMQLKTVGPEKFIIREGQQGTCFYIVAEGQLVAYKQRAGQNKLVYAFKKGDYFGELALVKNVPRQASVKSITDCRLYFINAEAFSRMLGPLETILRRNQERYSRWAMEMQHK